MHWDSNSPNSPSKWPNISTYLKSIRLGSWSMGKMPCSLRQTWIRKKHPRDLEDMATSKHVLWFWNRCHDKKVITEWAFEAETVAFSAFLLWESLCFNGTLKLFWLFFHCSLILRFSFTLKGLFKWNSQATHHLYLGVHVNPQLSLCIYERRHR